MGSDIEEYDILIIGTSLTHAILAAALSSAGRKVVHLDSHDFYGGANASISPPWRLEGMEALLEDFTVEEGPAFAAMAASREYNVELSPQLLYTHSAMIRLLRDLNISEYVQFKAMSSFYLLGSSGLTRVPSSKEDIFTSTTMALMTKRRLMKFIKFCTEYPSEELYEKKKDAPLKTILHEHFKLDQDLSDAACYVLGQARSATATVGEIVPVINTHIRGIGMFGAFPAVIPMYGGGSELTQAFCRKAAVKGCVYMLGQKISIPRKTDDVIVLESGHEFRAKEIVADSGDCERKLKRRVVVVKGDFDDLMQGGDGASIAIAPSRTDMDVIHCQVHGSGTGSCPAGQSIMYFQSTMKTPQAEFDVAQSRLLQDRSCEIILTMGYTIGAKAGDLSYDQAIDDARVLFQRFTTSTEAFLPAEESDDESPVYETQ